MPLKDRDRVVALLRTYNDARETLQRGDAGGTFYADARLLLMPDAFHEGSYVNLEGVLLGIRRLWPGHFRNVTARYVFPERVSVRLAERNGCLYHIERIADSLEPEKFINMLGVPFERDGCAEILNKQEIRNWEGGTIQRIVRAPRGKGADGREVQVAIARWQEWVEPQMTNRAVDAITALMPRPINLPSEIYQWAVERETLLAA